MQNLLRRHLLALMLGVTALSYTASAVLIDAPAFAKNGADDGPGHDAGDDNGGDSGGSDDSSDDDNSGSGSDDNDDNSDSGSSDDNDDSDSSGSGSDDDSSDSNDDSNDDSSSSNSKSKSSKTAKNSNSVRPTATITLTPTNLANVQAGTHVVVDQLGRQLEMRVVMVNGQQVIRAKPHGGDAKRKPGPINTIRVVPISTVGGGVGNDDGTPDQGPGDN